MMQLRGSVELGVRQSISAGETNHVPLKRALVAAGAVCRTGKVNFQLNPVFKSLGIWERTDFEPGAAHTGQGLFGYLLGGSLQTTAEPQNHLVRVDLTTVSYRPPWPCLGTAVLCCAGCRAGWLPLFPPGQKVVALFPWLNRGNKRAPRAALLCVCDSGD